MKDINLETAYNKSVEFLKDCVDDYGFRASLERRDNYYRIWSRDGVINGLAALMTEESGLIKAFKSNLKFLARFQGRNGQIPSNVSPENEKVSYGRTAGRVDATLWFVIGCVQYFKRTKDEEFIKNVKENIDKAMNVSESWEFNGKNFIFVPSGGDWADEFLRHGYILFDQLLYNRAIKEYMFLSEFMDEDCSYWKDKYRKQREMINVNFWPNEKNVDWDNVYHKQMFKSVYGDIKNQEYWLENFYPGGASDKFDSFTNILSIIFDFSDDKKSEKIVDYFLSVIGSKYLPPAFYPVIFPEQKREWREMRGNFSFRFKNKPYHSHNGGLWPMLGGFLIRALCKIGQNDLAEEYLKGVNYANYLGENEWSFYEYHDGKEKNPGGVKNVAWSASGGIIGYLSFKEDKKIFL